MTREEKNQAIEELQAMLKDTNVVYLTDASSLNSADTTKLRGECYKADINMQVVKNTLLRIAMERTEDREYGELYEVLKGQTALMTSTVGNAPAKLIKEFRKRNERPLLKGAYVEEAVYIGDEQLTALTEIKSKEELVGELIGLLQSPIKNVLGSLQSGGNTISGLVKALSEREA
ncbi:MAG: 50S ribosomal protein L10 [Flavobacteriales bacterium]|nr:50S ribosomal protein L10 [Flavobacteriales bacterium]